VICPNVPELTPDTSPPYPKLEYAVKLVWLMRLNASARPSSRSFSVRLKLLVSDASLRAKIVRYHQVMTRLLQEALRRVESLSAEEQDVIASQIIETLDDEEEWSRRFGQNRTVLRSLAREALEEHRRGETRPLDELIG